MTQTSHDSVCDSSKGQESINDASPAKNHPEPSNTKETRRRRPRKPKQKPTESESVIPLESDKPRREKAPRPRRTKPKPPVEGSSENAIETDIQPKTSRKSKAKSFKERMDRFSLGTRALETTSPRQKPENISNPQQTNQMASSSKINSRTAPDYSAKDLRTKLTYSLTDASYECMVCWETVKPKNPTWSCKHCWAVFHLPCIKRWSQSSEKKPGDISFVDDRTGWRCPGCQSSQDEVPSQYKCFCHKVTSPDYNKFTTPHSCGQPCQKSRGDNCPHPCPEPCHPGPCPPCTAMSPPAPCYCGQNVLQTRCVEQSKVAGYSCFNPCGELLGCGKHICSEPCHDGTCPPCKEEETQMCYCGGQTKVALCGSGVEEPTWVLDPETQTRTNTLGSFSCRQPCDRPFDCNEHLCPQICHPLDREPSCCPKNPMFVNTCPCGKTLLSEISMEPRKSCKDEIPLCSKQCSKQLECSHLCQALCHEGECPPCVKLCKQLCRCGSTSAVVLCSDSKQERLCDKVCHQKMFCSRHRCTQVCCPSLNKKNQTVDDGHICFEACDKKLNCGQHFCSQLCHKGPCKPCMEASFDDLSCSCGKTVLRAPIPCGAAPPECNLPCSKPRRCGHSIKLTHNCHTDSTECPPCTALTTKLCKCGKKDVKFVPCFRQSPSCGTLCGKVLPCGAHVCKQVCHDGPCLSPSEICKAICHKPLVGCGHPCKLNCHAPSLCPENPSCTTSVEIPCECGRRTVPKICNNQPLSQRQPVACDNKCLLEIRNKKLAEAFGVTTPSVDVTTQYDRYIFVFITPTQLKWVKEIEQKINTFVKDSDKKVLHFNPMRDFQRKFLHCIATNYQIKSLSLDDPPNKSVQYSKTPQTRIPAVLPSEAYKFPEKYMLAEEEQESESKSVRQATNMILLRNLELTPSVSHLVQKALSSTNMEADIFMYGNNVVIKPHSNTSDVVLQEDSIRVLFYQVRSVLNSSNISTKTCLGWVNASLEVVWPKLDSAVPVFIPRGLPASTTNKFSFLDDHQPSLPHSSTLTYDSSRQPSRPKVLEPACPLPPSEPENVVDDWTELI